MKKSHFSLLSFCFFLVFLCGMIFVCAGVLGVPLAGG